METLKRYILSLVISLIFLLIFSFLLNILNYFDMLNSNFYKTFSLLFLIISIFAGSYFLGYRCISKGYLNGLLFGIIVSLLFTLLSLILKSDLSIASIIYYLIIILTSSIGGAIGINKKTTEINQ